MCTNVRQASADNKVEVLQSLMGYQGFIWNPLGANELCYPHRIWYLKLNGTIKIPQKRLFQQNVGPTTSLHCSQKP